MIGAAGVGLLIGCLVMLWRFLPVAGRPHPAMSTNVLSWTIPLAITSGIALGITLILSGILHG